MESIVDLAKVWKCSEELEKKVRSIQAGRLHIETFFDELYEYDEPENELMSEFLGTFKTTLKKEQSEITAKTIYNALKETNNKLIRNIV